jgi:hypothetical protein
MSCDIEKETVLTGMHQVILKGLPESPCLVKVGIVDVEIPLVLLKPLKKRQNGRPFRLVSRGPPGPFKDEQRSLSHLVTSVWV